MFGLFEETIGSALNILDDITNGEAPSKRDVAKIGSTVVEAYLATEIIDGVTKPTEE